MGGFERRLKPDVVGKQFPIAAGERPAAGDDLRQTLELFPTNGSLNVGHAVVVAEHGMLLEDDLSRTVPHRVGNAHTVLAKHLEFGVPFVVRRREHAAIACAHDLARMEREARDIAAWAPDLLELAFPRYLAADRTCRVFHNGKTVTARDCKDRRQIARHTHLV